MVGAAVPDAAKVYLLLGGVRTTVAGVEVAWLALQTLGAGLAFALVGALLVPPRERRPVVATLVGGVCLHVGMDYFVIRTGGLAPPYLYPFTWTQLPAGNLYLSADAWPALVAVAVAALVFAVDRRRTADSTG
jgi:membrane-bound metal-dependent hydrolase YbcI (DUF457 family)